MGMVYDAQVRYERRLFAIASGPDAERLAQAYVAELRPCYEWEGFPDCPEREAKFADAYQSAHPGGPFARYLPLLSAHRWLCAAQLPEREGSLSDDNPDRRAYNRVISVAVKTKDPLVRAAAEALRKRDSCFPARESRLRTSWPLSEPLVINFEF